MSTIYAFTGKKGSGKDTAAHALIRDHGYSRVAFADPVRQVAHRVFGLTYEEMLHPDLKEIPIERWPFESPRVIMQKVGTDAFRNNWPRVWIEAFLREVKKHERVVVTDLRFLNEALAITSLGGEIIRIIRPDTDDNGDMHVSETEMNSITSHHTIINSGSILDLEAAVKDVTIWR